VRFAGWRSGHWSRIERRASGRRKSDLWKTCGTVVERLCTCGQRQNFFASVRRKSCESLDRGAASHRASLARRRTTDTILSLVNIVKYQETIHGRSYVIEVRPVGQHRWRAQIAGVPGRTTALMPFYGATPDEAARSLSVWLTRAATQTN